MQRFQNALAYFATAVSYRGKMFMKLKPVEDDIPHLVKPSGHIIKLFFSVFDAYVKLECLSLTSSFMVALHSRVRPRAY